MIIKQVTGEIIGVWESIAEAVAEGADLRKAILVQADLRGADLRGADMRGADLRGAHLTGAVGAYRRYRWCRDPYHRR